MQTRSQAVNKNYRNYTRAAMILLPLVISLKLHEQKNTFSHEVINWLPNYLWSISLLIGMVWFWNGWHKIPLVWKNGVWLLLCASEVMQFQGWIPGTAYIYDIIGYQLAFLSVYVLQKAGVV